VTQAPLSLLLTFTADGKITASPIADTLEDAQELEKRLRQFLTKGAENPSEIPRMT